MMDLRLTFIIIIITFINIYSLNATEVKIIELHNSKSLDQLVLETENIKNNQDNEIENSSSLNSQKENDQKNKDDNTIDSSNSNEKVTILKSNTILDLNDELINVHLENIKDIKSKTLNREFIKILSSNKIEDQQKIDKNVFPVVKKLYEIGEIGRAYKLIKSIELNNISNKANLTYFYLVELNYLFSTFNLFEACELKSFLMERSINITQFLLEKTDIFCLTLENKFAEAKLLNSLLVDSEKDIDQNFQKLFNYMILNDQDKKNLNFESLLDIKSKELIFLYSAMLRINELALDEDFIEIDPLNLSIPVILSNSSKMDVRIKAANKALYDEVISIDSLAALYQSVDFNSKEFNKPKETINSFKKNNELTMAFYYQLINIQIFPDQRLSVVLDYWQFAKSVELEKIAYAITENVLNTFKPTSENTKHGIEIALAHISNKNYVDALKWINLYENSNTIDDKTEYAKFLIALNETNELDVVIDYIYNNYSNIIKSNDQKTHETLDVLINFLNIENISQIKPSFKSILDERYMPSYFLIRDIKKNIEAENELSFFILSLISMNDKKWRDLHPEHLNIILSSFNLYDQGSLIKPLILEILNEFEIF